MLEFLVILIKVIAPCIGVWAVIHYINVYNEKKYPQFYDHDEKMGVEWTYDHYEIGYPTGMIMLIDSCFIIFLVCLVGAYVDGELNWFTGGIF